MKSLAIDTSNMPLTVAVLDDERLLATMTATVQRDHGASLMPVIATLLERAAVSIDKIDRFVVAAGPGSYTGLRIGVTTAKTLATTLNRELVGVSSLRELAAGYQLDQHRLIVPVFDARRNNVFAGAYQWHREQLTEVIPDQHISLVDLATAIRDEDYVFVGSDCWKLHDQLVDLFGRDVHVAPAQFNYPQAYILGLLGRQMAPVANVDAFVPRYLRLTQAEADWYQQHPEEKGHLTNYVEKY
ncbi:MULTISPECIES: tRNA (adenosine(37)-N6)-threonylcarbamoyltransferase complex dimerization subunit type 1 TsaB [unclassified Ligilactobacillus]|uniref:tRNA (adenosine(37)-N6)-threonylcarbamoyltransferase complex dimerization subunit type 1 TsaB n=1 Tax=unclassified Ligilactobacillus TaxID=2767920 RepID=UPI003854B923